MMKSIIVSGVVIIMDTVIFPLIGPKRRTVHQVDDYPPHCFSCPDGQNVFIFNQSDRTLDHGSAIRFPSRCILTSKLIDNMQSHFEIQHLGGEV